MDNKPKTLIERFGFKDADLATPEHDEMLLWILDKNNILKVLTEVGICYGPEDRAHFIDIKAESPVLGYNSFNIGFIDVEIIIERTNSKGGYLDLDNICIEIKPHVHSIGELIRQINLYRSHERREFGYRRIDEHYWIVMTKTPNLKEVLKNQKILVYEFNPLLEASK